MLSLLKGQAFDPEAVKLLVTAFERACDRLDLSDQLDPLMVELVATLTIDFATQGERDPARLSDLVCESLMMPEAK
jgi:hypothetical protein